MLLYTITIASITITIPCCRLIITHRLSTADNTAPSTTVGRIPYKGVRVTYIYIYIYVHTYTYIHMHYIHMYMYVYIYIYMYACIYIYIYIYVTYHNIIT